MKFKDINKKSKTHRFNEMIATSVFIKFTKQPMIKKSIVFCYFNTDEAVRKG